MLESSSCLRWCTNEFKAPQNRRQGQTASSNHQVTSENNLANGPSSPRQASTSQYDQYAWHPIHRPWSTATAHDQLPLSGRDQHSSSNQRAVVSPASAYDTPAGLSLASLQQLDDVQEEADSMALWVQEDQRTAPWDAVGYVRREPEQTRRG